MATRQLGTDAAAPRSVPVIARDPSDVKALLWFLLVCAIGLLAARGAEQTTAGIETDIVQVVTHLPNSVSLLILIGIGALHALLVLGIPLVLAAMRRWRQLGVFLLGMAITSVLMLLGERLVPDDPGALPDVGQAVAAAGSWTPSGAVARALTAMVLLSPNLSTPWRRFGWVYVALVALERIATAEEVLLDLVLAVGIGGTVGHALLLAFGRRSTMPTAAAVSAALSRVGLPARSVEPAAVKAVASLPFVAELLDGQRVHCKVLTPGQYEADRLLRGYRRVRIRELGEEAPFSTVRRAAAVEAMLAMTAAGVGARSPAVRGVAPVDAAGEEMVIAFEYVDGDPLDGLPAERITDAVLDQAWHAVARMRATGIAHRDLQLSSWMLDGRDQLWVIDFSFGDPAASDGALSLDIAELLAATYAAVGAQRAVASALRVLGSETLASGLGHLVPVALTRATRGAVKSAGGLEPLVSEVADACGVEEPQFAPIERVKPRTLLMAALLAIAVYVLLPQLADLPRMVEAIGAADPLLAGAALLASAATYIGSSLAISGACPAPLRYLHSLLAAFAASFVGSMAPPGVAHAGLNVRYYQKQGLSPTVAVSSTAAKEVGVGAVHVVLLLLMAFVAGSSSALMEELDKLPSLSTVGLVVAVVIAAIGIAAATPRFRRMVVDTVVPALKHSAAAMADVVASPVKMVELFLGGLVLQLGYVSALYFSVQALGQDVGFVTIGLIYLTVGSAASIAPTPGGVGAVETVLLAALTGVGVASAPALAAVFLYRLVTFWMPIPVGGLSMRYMVSRELI